MPRPPPPPQVHDSVHDTERTATIPPEMMQQAMQRLFVAYNQCVTRVAQTDDRLEQFRSTIRRDALDIALTVQRAGKDIQHQQQAIEHIKSTLFEDVQERVKSLEERLRSVMDHEVHVNQTIDRNTHSQCASISALISEQGDVRKLVEELANRLDQSQEASSTVQSEVSTNVLLEISDLKSKVLRLTEQSTKLDGDLSFLKKMSEQVELLEDQVIKWRYRLPELTDDESKERIVSAVEVREELDEFKEVVLRKLKEFLTNLNALQESVRLIENDKEESWEAISHKVSTLVEDSVGSLTERLTELEHTVQSRRTTPVSDDDVLNMETWSTMEQAIWSELGKVREQAQEVPNLYTLCEHLHENQKSQERQLSGLRSFARQVEQFLARMKAGATAPRKGGKGSASESLGYVPGASASSSATSSGHLQIPKPPTATSTSPVPQRYSIRRASSIQTQKGSTLHFQEQQVKFVPLPIG